MPTPSSQHNSRKYNLNFIDKKFKHLSCVFYVVAPHLLAGHCDVNFTISIGWNQFNYNRIYLQTLALYNCWRLPDTRPVLFRGSIFSIDVWKLVLKFNISLQVQRSVETLRCYRTSDDSIPSFFPFSIIRGEKEHCDVWLINDPELLTTSSYFSEYFSEEWPVAVLLM